MGSLDRVNRRDVIKLGAVGAAVAGLGARRAGPAAAAGTTNGVHIHATLLVISDGPGAPPGATQRLFSQRGSIAGDVVKLKGGATTGFLEGTGVVMRI